MQDFVGDAAPELFTEKLNLKRPEQGGVNPLHQDYPYWVDVADDPATVATAMLFLDDSTLDNGCLRVVPGSHTERRVGPAHRRQPVPRQRDRRDRVSRCRVRTDRVRGGNRRDVRLVPGAPLRAEPIDRQRRALLFSYQPAGRAHMLEALRKLAPDRRA